MTVLKAAMLNDVPEGRAITVTVGGEDIALCKVDGEIYAVANVCTHDDGPLGGGYLTDHAIECPRHGARFNVKTGAVESLPAMMPIETFDVEVVGDEIYVDVG
jgi:3-phenylpropionate/trans-cinnamate dioxygenase ferredoxin subunit